MGLAWWLPDTESPSGYFKFLPKGMEKDLIEPSINRISRLEELLLQGVEDGSSRQKMIELIELREQRKDWLLNQLPTYINSSLNASPHLRCPPSRLLLSPQVIELVEDIHKLRAQIIQTIEG